MNLIGRLRYILFVALVSSRITADEMKIGHAANDHAVNRLLAHMLIKSANGRKVFIVQQWKGGEGGRLAAEREAYNAIISKSRSSSREERDTDSHNDHPGSSVSYVILIQTPRKRGLNILTTEDLLLHVAVMSNASQLEVEVFGEKWSLTDLCYKPASPSFETSLGLDIKD
ncbi:unnamed protein product, partial [Soboliphyme baturini]|uniref:Cysteine proteinase inhibitor n=1 Tax=Soboliphyme baturini TaxID=241478 RepID=A0A183IP24_9BILA